MDTGYSRSPKLLKGAIIQFSAPLLIPIPNIIIFQYNPETITRSMSPWAPPELDEKGNVKDPKIAAKLSQPYDPQETFSVALELDAADALEHPDTHPVAVLTGVADRIAALEMLMYPPQDSALGGLLNISVSVSIGAGGISGGIGEPLLWMSSSARKCRSSCSSSAPARSFRFASPAFRLRSRRSHRFSTQSGRK